MIELYINSKLVELETDTEVTLERFSPIFNDVSKIGEDYTYSIEVPATPSNNSIFGFANRVDSYALDHLANLTASMYVDGVAVIPQGSAQVLEITPEGYNITISWGGISALSNAWNEKISDVYTPASESEAHVYWRVNGTTGLTPIGTMADEGYGFWRYYGQEGYEGLLYFKRRYILPMVSTSYLLSLIEQGVGVTFDTSNIGEWLIPLTTRNGSAYGSNNGNSTYVACTASADVDELPAAIYVNFAQNPIYDASGIDYDADDVDPDNIIDNDRLRATDGVLNILNSSISIALPTFPSINGLSLSLISYDSSDVVLSMQTIGATINGNIATFLLDYESEHPNLAYVKMRVNLSYEVQAQHPAFALEFHFQAYATNWVRAGGLYPILNNLPDISVGQLIEVVCQLSGVYAATRSDGVIAFNPLADAVDDTFVRDMSKKYRSEYEDSSLVTTTYVAEGFAQNNRFVYSESNARVSGDGMFSIDNPLLPKESTIVELPFSATDTLEGLLHLPLYDAEGKWQGYDGIPIVSVATDTFDSSLKWNNILATSAYRGWVQLLQGYKEVTFLMQLTAVDMARLQWEYSWQIDALGGLFVPTKITYRTNGVSEVSAIKIV